MRLAVLLCGACLAAFAACAGSDGAGSGDFERHDVDEAGFAVSVPSDWKTVDEFGDEALEAFSEDNPHLAPYVEGVAESIKFISIDPDTEDEFATNLNVGVYTLAGPMTFDDWVSQETASIREIPTVRAVRSTRTRLPAGKAARLTWQYELAGSEGRRPVAVLQYLVLGGGSAYVLTYTTLPRFRARYERTFTRSARSFRLL